MRVGVAIFFCFLSFWCLAQDFQYSLRNYKAIDGLPQSQVRILREDKNGYLWVGTEGGGLARFDGRQFKVYTTLDGLQSNIVNYIDFDDDDNLWVAHPRGITRFDGLTFKKFEQPGGKESSTRLRRLFVYNDTVFFMSAPGYIGKIHDDSVYYWSRPIFPSKDGGDEHLISFVRKNSDGSLIFCIKKEQMFCRHATGDFWLDFKKHFNEIKNIFDYKGQSWFVTDKGYFILDVKKRMFIASELPVKSMVVYHDQQQDVFWTFNQNRLLKEYKDKGAMRIDTVLRDVDVTQVLVDSEGNTWFGTDASGLYKYFIQDFDRCSSDKMRGVMAIYTDTEGTRWIGTSARGLWKIKKGKIKHYSTPKGSRRNGFFNITQGPDGTLWAGSSDGIGKFDPVKDDFIWQKPHPESQYNGVISIQFDKDSAMWLGVMGGGVVYRHGARMKIFTEDNGLATNWVMSLVYLPKFNTVFIGDEFGVSALHDNKVQVLEIEEMRNTSVVALASWRDSLVLVSTGGVGVLIYDPQTHIAKSITTKDIYGLAPKKESPELN
jgi:ligand-binding sensor domain-containing protein